jgi:hypothetical protein
MASATAARRARRSKAMKALRFAILSALVGVGVQFLIFLGRPVPFGWRLATYGALLGLSTYAFCHTLFVIVVERIYERRILPRPLVAAVVFFFGGARIRRLSRLVSSAAAASGDLLDRLLDSVRAASPGALQDDWTVLLVERRA